MTRAIHTKSRPGATTAIVTAFVRAATPPSRIRRMRIRGPCRSRVRWLAGIGAVTGAFLFVAGDKSVAQGTDNTKQKTYGNWTYHVVQNPLEGEEFSQIYTAADSVSSRNEATLAIRCRSDQIHAVLFTNRHFRTSDRIQLEYQIDSNKMITVRWRFVRNEAILMSPSGDWPIRFIASLRGAKQLTIRVRNNNGVLMNNRYIIGGFDQAIVPIGRSCGF